MKIFKIKYIAIAVASLLMVSCNNDDNMMEETSIDFSGTFVQKDQMGRPAVNTVFVSSDSKDAFNTTIPSQQGAMFQSMFQTNLTGLSPAYANDGDTNALGLDAATFTGLLATDVLNVSLDGTTTFYDGTNVLTGRALADDVITVELLLIFGGEDFSENPSLSNDNVDSNDKEFSDSFPYLASPW
ncbi:hypothetical protein BW723_13150 [Polaribacter reichenbachii]|uniref:DUF4331 domain-containing protein n=1 Tax=Polaribacter reichenbachii TaxID=996801 RepID=A0A1B8TZW9_9FLAO|nr:DUF4331 family protein [Polaribacter reichenbachii]APZ47172.1 hypothetical protein BW723_13150 [Polaribacter reichenbachii]AUC17812.1 hypothetical protein BTO17_03595 [Polaribacter reichenbachii]OBY65164.1 hypothetical protein LPB301_08630 [Polaribacter reichenbachii]